MGKKIGVAGILVVLIGISIYMWTTKAEVEYDPRLQALGAEKQKCPHCEHEFELTLDEQRDMLRHRGDIFCPNCGEGGSRRTDVQVSFGAQPNPFVDDDEGEDETEVEEDEDAPPRLGGGGMSRPR